MKFISLVLAFALLFTGCAGGIQNPGGTAQSARDGKEPEKMSYTLSEPVYPEFPQQPVMPEEGGEQAWNAYSQAYDKYLDALDALRGENANITEAEHAVLTAFAAKSAPLAIAGHEGENAIYSPLSLWFALAMLAPCANGDSRLQVMTALNLENLDSLEEMASHIWQTLYTDDGLSSLILANSIWLNSGLEGNYVRDTLDTLAQKYFAGAYSVPMGTGEADQAVTDWVKKQTNGLIGGDSPVVETKAETLALLASSLYYKAAWMDEFLPHLTQEDIFTDAAGNESRVDFMHKTHNANFIRRDGYQAAALSTQLGEMVFVLPDEGVTPESLLEEPDFLSRLEFYGDAPIWGEVQWSVPKFDVNSDLGLLDALAAMGITDLPNPEKADLSALTDLDAFLSDAKQLARVKVDEEGVEAAAVTILTMDCTSALIPEELPVCVMNLNRPFLFIVRTQDVPLFVGIVNQA